MKTDQIASHHVVTNLLKCSTMRVLEKSHHSAVLNMAQTYNVNTPIVKSLM